MNNGCDAVKERGNTLQLLIQWYNASWYNISWYNPDAMLPGQIRRGRPPQEFLELVLKKDLMCILCTICIYVWYICIICIMCVLRIYYAASLSGSQSICLSVSHLFYYFAFQCHLNPHCRSSWWGRFYPCLGMESILWIVDRPNSTDLYFWYSLVCQETNIKDIAG